MDKAKPNIAVEYTEAATVAVLTDDKILDESEVSALESSIVPLIEQNPGINLIMDFSSVEFLTSSVLGLLIRISKKVHEGEGQLRLCGINSKILDIFRITRLDKVFDIHEGRQEALESLE